MAAPGSLRPSASASSLGSDPTATASSALPSQRYIPFPLRSLTAMPGSSALSGAASGAAPAGGIVSVRHDRASGSVTISLRMPGVTESIAKAADPGAPEPKMVTYDVTLKGPQATKFLADLQQAGAGGADTTGFQQTWTQSLATKVFLAEGLANKEGFVPFAGANISASDGVKLYRMDALGTPELGANIPRAVATAMTLDVLFADPSAPDHRRKVSVNFIQEWETCSRIQGQAVGAQAPESFEVRRLSDAAAPRRSIDDDAMIPRKRDYREGSRAGGRAQYDGDWDPPASPTTSVASGAMDDPFALPPGVRGRDVPRQGSYPPRSGPTVRWGDQESRTDGSGRRSAMPPPPLTRSDSFDAATELGHPAASGSHLGGGGYPAGRASASAAEVVPWEQWSMEHDDGEGGSGTTASAHHRASRLDGSQRRSEVYEMTALRPDPARMTYAELVSQAHALLTNARSCAERGVAQDDSMRERAAGLLAAIDGGAADRSNPGQRFPINSCTTALKAIRDGRAVDEANLATILDALVRAGAATTRV